MPNTSRYDPESYERETTIGGKIVETPLHLKLGSLLFSSGSSNSGTTLHEGVGEGRYRGPLGQSASTNFVAYCRNLCSYVVWLTSFYTP